VLPVLLLKPLVELAAWVLWWELVVPQAWPEQPHWAQCRALGGLEAWAQSATESESQALLEFRAWAESAVH
jgi:hypothetical protein